jgi:hypothetical protein
MIIEYEPKCGEIIYTLTQDPNNGLICDDSVVIFFALSSPASGEELIGDAAHGVSELAEHAITLRGKVL